VRVVRPIARIAVLLSLLLVGSVSTFGQDDVIQTIERDLSALSPFEQLIAIELGEKEIVRQLEAIIANPTFGREGPTFMLKVASASFLGLALVSEKPFPPLGGLHRQRSETYGDVVRGKLKFGDMGPLERENERQKAVYLGDEIRKFKQSEGAPDEARMRTLAEAGTIIGRKLIAAARIVSAPQ
jgi:hypothetical protein